MGQLNIGIGANIDDFLAKLTQVERAMKNVGQNVENMGKAVSASVEKNTIQTLSATKNMTEGMNGQFEVMYDKLSELSRFKGVFTEILGVAGISATLTGFTKQIVNVRSEFQNTEAMFKVFLGDAKKAADFMSEMEDYAYNNVFEFSDLTKQAAQLLAYKTNVEDVTDVLDRLSNVAAGTNTSLAELVSTYNKVKANDRLDSNAVQSLSNKGIDVYSVLAEQRGTSRDTIKAQTLEFKDLQEALRAVTDEGGMFYGMMNEKMKTLGDSIGLLQDNVTLMFNEIGKGLQDDLRTAIYGAADVVGWLAENYKTIGETLIAIAATYGTYRAAVVATTVIEKAHKAVLAEAILQKKLAAASNITLSNSAAVAAAREVLFTNAVKQNTAAALKNAAAWLANPAVATTAGVVALGFAMYSVYKIVNDNTTAEERLNKELGKRYKKINEAIDGANEYARVIAEEKDNVDKLTDSYKELAKYLDISEEKLRAMTNEEIQSAIKEKGESEKNKVTEDKKAELFARRGNLQNATKRRSTSRTGQEMVAELQVGAEMSRVESEIKALAAIIAKTESDAMAQEGKSLRERRKLLVDNAKEQEAMRNSVSKSSSEWLFANEKIKEYNKLIIELNNAIENEGKNDASTLIRNKAYWEKQAKQAQSEINAITTDELATAEGQVKKNESVKRLQEANEQLKKYSIKDMDEYNKAVLSLEDKVAQERNAIEMKRVKDKHKIIENDLANTLKAIDKEEREFNKANGSSDASRKAFDDRRNIVKIAAEIDHEQADKDFEKWLDSLEKDIESTNLSIEISNLQMQADMTDDINEKLKIQQKIRSKNVEAQLKSIELEKQQQILQQGGEEELAKYLSGGEVSDTTKSISDKYEKKQKATATEFVQEGVSEDLSTKLSTYKAYAEEMVAIAQWEKNEIDKINLGDSMANEDYIKKQAENQRQMVNQKYQASGAEIGDLGLEGVGNFADLVDGVLRQSQDSIMEYYETVKGELDRVIEQEKADVESLRNERADLESQREDNNNSIEALDSQINEVTDEQQKNKLITERSKLLSNQATIEEKIASTDKAIESSLNRIAKGQAAITTLTNATNEANKNAFDPKKADKYKKNLGKAAEALQGIQTALDIVDSTFGGMLNDAGATAMSVMKTVVSSTISVIMSIVTATEAGATAIEAVESASVILAIIGAAMAIINAIVNAIVANCSKAAKLQKDIDRATENVEELNRQHKTLERYYKSSEGAAYYRAQIALAKDLEKSLEEQNKRLEKARELERLRVSQYGSDSKKAKEARDQVHDFEDELADSQEQMEEYFKTVFEDLATTDATSFGESMAEAMVEGFETGISGMEDAWDDTMTGLVKSMLTKQLSMQLTDMFKNSFDNLKDYTKDGSLSQGEIDSFVKELEATKENAMSVAQMYAEAMKQAGVYDDVSMEAESRGFAAMSQDTADELNGRFTALQISGAAIQAVTSNIDMTVTDISKINSLIAAGISSMLERQVTISDVSERQLRELVDIKDNTSILSRLESRLRAIEENTGRL